VEAAAAAAAESPRAGQLALFADPGEVGPLPPPSPIAVPPPLAPLPAPPPERPARLSFSALSLLDRCGYRFYAERLLGFPPVDRRRVAGEGVGGAEIGTAVHAALESPDLPLDAVLTRFDEFGPAEQETVARLVAGWRDSPLAARLADRPAAREVPLLLDVDGIPLTGYLDLVVDGEQGVEVVDYKTNRLEDRTAAEVRDSDYSLQEVVYALALLERGAPAVDVHFAFLDAGTVVSRRFAAGDAPALRAQVTAAVARAVSGPYLPRPGPPCAECPVLGVLCAGPDLDALHGAPDAV
jgi:hypothetical protein